MANEILNVAIIDYGSGNLHSAAKAFERVAADCGGTVTVTDKPDDLAKASHIVLPGVGAYADCKAGLTAVDGMMDALQDQVINKAKPFLGICVGMQLMADWGREHGDTPGFGWIGGEVAAIAAADKGLKIPHMGWNALEITGDHPAFADLPAGAHTYFVHSYSFRTTDPAHVLATVDYGGPITAVIGRDNMIGTQFHPEKSQRVGLAFIRGYLEWRP